MSGPRRRKFLSPTISRVTWHGCRGRRTSAAGPFSASCGEGLGEGDEGLELPRRGAGIDRLRGQRHALLEVPRLGPDDERGGGVHEHDVAPGAGVAGEDPPDDLGVLLPVPTPQIADPRAAEPEILRSYP